MRLIERLLKQGKDIVFGRIFTEEATDAQNFVSVEEAKPEMKIAEPEDETFSTDRAVVDQLSKDIKRVPPEFVDQLMEEGYVELQ